MKPKITPLSPSNAVCIEKMAIEERKQRALAMADLMARASLEMTSVTDHDTDQWLQDSLRLVAKEHIHDLAFLLGITKTPPENL